MGRVRGLAVSLCVQVGHGSRTSRGGGVGSEAGKHGERAAFGDRRDPSHDPHRCRRFHCIPRGLAASPFVPRDAFGGVFIVALLITACHPVDGELNQDATQVAKPKIAKPSWNGPTWGDGYGDIDPFGVPHKQTNNLGVKKPPPGFSPKDARLLDPLEAFAKSHVLWDFVPPKQFFPLCMKVGQEVRDNSADPRICESFCEKETAQFKKTKEKVRTKHCQYMAVQMEIATLQETYHGPYDFCKGMLMYHSNHLKKDMLEYVSKKDLSDACTESVVKALEQGTGLKETEALQQNLPVGCKKAVEALYKDHGMPMKSAGIACRSFNEKAQTALSGGELSPDDLGKQFCDGKSTQLEAFSKSAPSENPTNFPFSMANWKPMVTFEEFKQMILKAFPDPMDAFIKYDINEDGNLNEKEWLQMGLDLGVSTVDMHILSGIFNKDKNKKISKDEWQKIMVEVIPVSTKTWGDGFGDIDPFGTAHQKNNDLPATPGEAEVANTPEPTAAPVIFSREEMGAFDVDRDGKLTDDDQVPFSGHVGDNSTMFTHESDLDSFGHTHEKHNDLSHIPSKTLENEPAVANKPAVSPQVLVKSQQLPPVRSQVAKAQGDSKPTQKSVKTLLHATAAVRCNISSCETAEEPNASQKDRQSHGKFLSHRKPKRHHNNAVHYHSQKTEATYYHRHKGEHHSSKKKTKGHKTKGGKKQPTTKMTTPTIGTEEEDEEAQVQQPPTQNLTSQGAREKAEDEEEEEAAVQPTQSLNMTSQGTQQEEEVFDAQSPQLQNTTLQGAQEEAQTADVQSPQLQNTTLQGAQQEKETVDDQSPQLQNASFQGAQEEVNKTEERKFEKAD